MNVMKILLANAVSMLCAGAAVVLCYDGKSGWGWFLLVAVICFHWVGRNKEKE